jgi:two-component system LytT family response regulator
MTLGQRGNTSAQRFPIERRLALRDARTGAWRIIDRDSIDWIRTAGRGRVHGSVSGQPQTWRITISELERTLDPKVWLRIHRSVIVNAERIREVKPLHKGEYAITLADGTVFDSGRTYRAVVERFLDLLRGAATRPPPRS